MLFRLWNSSRLFTLVLLLLSGVLLSQPTPISSFYPDDASTAFRMAMNSPEQELILDSHFPVWDLRPMRFVNVSDKTIHFEENVELRAIPGAFPKKIDALLKFVDCRNIKLLGKGNVLAMNKEEYINGEWRHVIRLRGCTDVVIDNLVLRDSGGDGLTIGRSEKKLFSEKIYVSRIKSINNKRQGVSIVSAQDVWIQDSEFRDTKGTFPGAGVDLEPDLPTERLVNINFENCQFVNNYNAGIKIETHNLTGNSEPVSVRFKDCILVDNFSKDNPKVRAEITIHSHKTDPVGGEIHFEDILVKDSNWGLLVSRKNASGFHVYFKNLVARNICRDTGMSAIFLEVPHYKIPSSPGGFTFTDVVLEYESDVPVFRVRGTRWIPDQLEDMHGNITVKHKNQQLQLFDYINIDASDNKNVDFRITKTPR